MVQIRDKTVGISFLLLGLFTAVHSPLSQSSNFELEEVLVLSRKSPESLQSSPVAISVFTAGDIQARNFVDITDSGNASPNVNLGSGASFSGLSSAPVPFIRGIGSADFLVVNDPAVGIYLDQVYISRSIGALIDLLDIDRIEVLREPQGTLSGQNTLGGANLMLGDDNISAFRGQIRLIPSNYISLNLSVDFSREREGPAATIPITTGSLPGGNKEDGGRTKVFNDLLSGNNGCRDSTAQASNVQCHGSVWISTNSYETNARWTNKDGEFITPKHELDVFGIALLGNWETDRATATSITAFREFNAVFTNDLDHGPYIIFHNVNSPYDSEQITQEFQFRGSSFNHTLNYVTGLYYFHEQSVQIVSLLDATSQAGLPPSFGHASPFFNSNTRITDNQSTAAFINATWSFVTPT
jgi:iron complex outermembrane recepter protein